MNVKQDASFVRGDQTQMHQVLMNLCVNANQAMPGGGTLSIDLKNHPTNTPCPNCHFNLPGRFVLLSVGDTGMGMSESVRKRIFEPYFTTKEVGKGTGMGLAVVHGIINQHNGHICVQSAENKGTTFNIFLPSSGNAMSKSDTVQYIDYEGKESILIVDDEPMVGELVKETLSLHGYQTTLFTNSVEAAEHFDKHSTSYDLILTDYMMPELTGDKLSARIRDKNATVPIILATGFSNNITPEAALAMGISEFIMKPIIGEDLCKAVRNCLDEFKPKQA